MLVEIGCLVLGVPVGFLLRRKPLVVRLTDQVLTWSVRILLLLLGLAPTARRATAATSRATSPGSRASTAVCR